MDGRCWNQYVGYYNTYTRLKIVYQSNILLNLSGEDLNFEGTGSTLRYYPSSQSDKETLFNYFDGYVDRCFPKNSDADSDGND